MMEPHMEDPLALGEGTQASSQSYILSREEPASPGEGIKNGVSFYTFTLGLCPWDPVVKHPKEELKQNQTRDCRC